MTNEEAIKKIDDVLSSDYHYDETLGYQLTSDDFEWLEEAKKALEKQIPKKPKRVDKNYVFDGNWKKICPCCGVTLMERITTKDESYPVHYNMTKHCKCGQALDWSDT